MHYGSRIHQRTIALCRLKLDLVGRSHRGFIQPVPKPAHHPVHVQLAVGPEHHFQKDFAFQLELAGLIRVHRPGLENDLNLGSRCAAIIQIVVPGVGGDLLVGKAGRLHSPAIGTAIPLPRLRDPITEPSTCNCAFDTFRPTSAITGSSAFGQIKRSQLGCRQLRALLAFARQAIGVSEPASLHLLNRRIYGWCR